MVNLPDGFPLLAFDRIVPEHSMKPPPERPGWRSIGRFEREQKGMLVNKRYRRLLWGARATAPSIILFPHRTDP
jgi:hypothetical protein